MRTVPGSGAILLPEFETENYSVSKIYVVDGGSGYASTNPPKITISGTKTPIVEGVFYPIIDNGSIVSVKVINPGSGYFPDEQKIGTKIGIGTTSAVEEQFKTKEYGGGIIINVGGGIGSAIFENGYNVAITTTITGVSTLIPYENSRIYGFGNPIPANSVTGIGTGAKFEVWITYDGSPAGNPISTSIVLKDGGRGYAVGNTVSIAGTYLGGTTPTNNLSFSVSKVSSTSVISAANSSFIGVAGSTIVGEGYGAKFNISRDSSGKISSVQVAEGGRYYAVGSQNNLSLTDIISIAGTSIGGSTPADNLYLSPTILGTDILPEVLYVDKLDNNRFRVSGLSTSQTLNIKNYGIGTHSIQNEEPNSSSLIAIDNIIQSPLYKKGVVLGLSASIGIGNTIFLNSGISSLTSLDILKIDDELMKIRYIGIGSTNSVTVDRASYGSKLGVHTIGSRVNVLRGDYSIKKDEVHFTDPPYGKIGQENVQLNSSFHGRFFSRRYDGNNLSDRNLIIDDISKDFTGKETIVGTKPGTLNSLYKNKITGINTSSLSLGDVINLQFTENYYISKNTVITSIGSSEIGISPNHNINVGIATTTFNITRLNYVLKSNGENITALYSNNINNNPIILINNIPQVSDTDFIIDTEGNNTIKFIGGTPNAGRIINVAITTGYGYQPLVGASATVRVSTAGTISDIYLTGSGGGYRTAPIISIASTVGHGASITATIGSGGTITSLNITNPGSGYTSSSLPIVRIPIPLNYSNLGVAYTGGSIGSGEGAKVSVIVGNGSSIINFALESPGYGYKVGDILTPLGITTNPSVGVGFSEFRMKVTEVFTDKFGGFYPGQFVRLDDISQYFNGSKRKFQLTKTTNGIKDTFSVKVDLNSDLKSENNYFIFINDILQKPSESYSILGSKIIFTEPPKENSKCLILYYRGSSLDVEQIDPPRTIKEGDSVQIGENILNPYDREQFERVVKKIVSPEELDTFPYDSIGINTDQNNPRPLKWTKQTRDRIINGVLYSKGRPDLKSKNTPAAKLIKSILVNDNEIYVDNAFPLFVEDIGRGLTENLRDVIILDNVSSETATAETNVSFASSVSNISITNSGFGYKVPSPIVAISSSVIIKKDPIYNFSSVSGINTNYEIRSIVYGKSAFVGVGTSSLLVKSLDGKSWIADTVGYGNSIAFNSVAFAGTNTYIAVGQTGTIIKSTGIGTQLSSWIKCKLINKTIDFAGGETISDSFYDGEFKDVIYSQTKDTYVAVGKISNFNNTSPIFTAVGVGATEFFEQNKTNTKNLNSVVSNGDIFVAVGDDGVVYSSTDTKIWSLTIQTTQKLNKVIWNGSKFVIVGNNGTIITSENGLSWTIKNNINITNNLTNISYYDGIYVCLSENEDLYYSFDLSNWEKRITNQPNVLKDLEFVPSLSYSGRYIFVGSGATAFYSEPIYNKASAVTSTTNGIVTSVTIINGGFGYSQNNPPPVIFESTKPNREKIYSIKAKGDFGNLIGINTIGIGNLSLDFVLKSESYDNSTLGIGYSSLNTFGITYSQLEIGDYFMIYDSNVTSGYALTGITTSTGSIVGTSKSFIDGIYRVENVSAPSSGIVTVRCNFVPVPGGIDKSINLGINTTGFYGRYTWGKIYDYQNRARENPKDFIVNTNDGLSGLSTAAEIYRTRGLI